MSLTEIKIQNFRNYERLELDKFGVFNLLLGVNGSGKTNFLEAVFVLSQGEPFRKVSMEDLIRWGKDSFYIGGTIGNNTKEIGYTLQKKIQRLNHKQVSKSEFGYKSTVIAFLPEDIEIVTGSPDQRRDFMDRTLCLLDRDYSNSLSAYQRVLRQRNAQLKISPGDIHIWNNDFIKSGSSIIEKRIIFMRNIGVRISRIYSEFYDDEVKLKYFNTFRIEGNIVDSFARALDEKYGEETKRKISLVGPHRDNFEIKMLDKKSQSFASRGQTRLLALAFKLGILEYIQGGGPFKPVLLLDDVLLELDSRVRKKFIEKIAPSQIFMTATSMSLVSGIAEPDNVYDVADGTMKLK